MTSYDRFLAHLDRSGNCWTFDGDGRMRFRAQPGDRDTTEARPFAYKSAHGDRIPDDKRVGAQDGCHPRCARPIHMKLVNLGEPYKGGRKGTPFLVYLDDDVQASLEKAGQEPGATKRAIVGNALRLYLIDDDEGHQTFEPKGEF